MWEPSFLSAGFSTFSNTVLSLSNGHRLHSSWTPGRAGLDRTGLDWTYLRRQACSIVRPEVGPDWVLRNSVLRCPAACSPFDKIKTSAHVNRTSPRPEVCSFVYRLGNVLPAHPLLHLLLTHLARCEAKVAMDDLISIWPLCLPARGCVLHNVPRTITNLKNHKSPLCLAVSESCQPAIAFHLFSFE